MFLPCRQYGRNCKTGFLESEADIDYKRFVKKGDRHGFREQLVQSEEKERIIARGGGGKARREPPNGFQMGKRGNASRHPSIQQALFPFPYGDRRLLRFGFRVTRDRTNHSQHR